MKYGIGLFLLAIVATFYACGDGSIMEQTGEDDMALLNYGEFNPEGMKNLVQSALAACEEDVACVEAMENSKDITPPETESSSSEVDTTSKEESSSSEESIEPAQSSAVVDKSSSSLAVNSSSSIAVTPTSSVSESSSSSSVIQGAYTPTSFRGTCAPTPTTITKGYSTKWAYKNYSNVCSNKLNCFMDPEAYEWSFEGGDISTSTDANPEVVYANTGTYKASVHLKNGSVEGDTSCITSVTVEGPGVEGCTCSGPTFDPSSGDLKDNINGVKASWTISGCKSVDGLGVEEDVSSFTYAWSGTGVTGSGTSGSGSWTTGGSKTATVKVSNKYGKSMSVTCGATILDNRADVTGCSCSPTYSPSSADIKDGSPVNVTYKISGCKSITPSNEDLTSTDTYTYSWTGGGTADSKTISYSEAGSYSTSVTVTNKYKKSKTVSCSAKVLDTSPFKCNSGNSTALSAGGEDNNFAQVNTTANTCYSYQMDKSTRDYGASLQVGYWNGSGKMYYVDCNGDKGSKDIGNNWNAINMSYKVGSACTIYFYTVSNMNLQINMW